MNSSVYSSGTPADFFSLNNGVYFSGHYGDISIGSGNGYKTYLAWGTTGQSAHVINATGALGFSTNLGTTPALSGTTGFGTSGQVLVTGGSAAAPAWSGSLTGLTVVTTSGNVTAAALIPSGSTVPTNGVYLPAANAVGVATNSGERARFFASGGVSIGNTTDPGATNLSVTGTIVSASTIKGASTIGVGGATPAASGSGITFPAAQSASSEANTLDDYEEGTWTPVIAGSTTAGTYELVNVTALYTKIGRQVTITCSLNTASSITGGGSGLISITGLPFAKVASSQFLAACGVGGLAYTSGGTFVAIFGTTGSTSTLLFALNVTNAAFTYQDISLIGTSKALNFTLTYFTV